METEDLISITEMEIELLRDDIFQATSSVTVRVIEDAIEKRKEMIKSLKEKHGI